MVSCGIHGWDCLAVLGWILGFDASSMEVSEVVLSREWDLL